MRGKGVVDEAAHKEAIDGCGWMLKALDELSDVGVEIGEGKGKRGAIDLGAEIRERELEHGLLIGR